MFRKVLAPFLFFVLASASAGAQVRFPPDAIDLSQVAVYNSPADIASWPVTSAISNLQMQPTGSPTAGLSFTFSASSTWPDYTPPGWDGSLEYTVWAVVKINGQWYTSGFIQMWRTRASTGAPILTDFARNWAYDSRWGPMAGHQPQPGEQMGFFLSAGNARGVTTVTSLRERTNVVLVNLPANDTGSFAFSALPDSTRRILAADFNADSQPDILDQSTFGRVSLAINSTGTFQQVQSAYNGITSDWQIIDVGDFNGDGRPDLVWQYPTGPVVVWFNNGSAAPTSAYLYSGQTTWRVVAVADLDHDGNPDLIWQSPAGQVTAWLMRGTTFISAQQLSAATSVWKVVGARDFNGDGQADLVWQNPTGAVAVWMMNGTAFASAQYIYSGSTTWQVVGVADLDGDGKPDVLWRGPSDDIQSWMMNGVTVKTYKYVKATASGWQLSTTP
jgi:ketosteroid isomerase-like protein